MDTLGLRRNAIIVVFVMVVISSIFSIGIVHQITPAAAQQFSMANRILLDNSEGNIIGWNPNGNRMSFTIFDEQFNPDTSTVIVNTFQSNFVVCNVDYMYDGAFEVNCTNAPANGGQLHYTIVNLPASNEGAQATVAQQVANQIAQRENAANQTQLR
jgi:hypothetical protein